MTPSTTAEACHVSASYGYSHSVEVEDYKGFYTLFRKERLQRDEDRSYVDMNISKTSRLR